MITKIAIPLIAAGLLIGCQQADSASSTNAHEHMAKSADAVSSIDVIERDLAHPWTIDRTESTITFEGKQGGETFTGCFDDFDLQIDLDPDNPETGAIYLTINMASAVGGSEDRNAALPGKEWFHIKSFPTAEFVSENIRREGKSAYVAEGNLLLKGVSKTVALPFTLDVNGDTAKAVGQTNLNRLDFNVGNGEFKTDEWIDFKVIVKIDITATR